MLFSQKASKCLKIDCNVQSGWEGFGGRMDTCIRVSKSLHCSPETLATWLIRYISVQNVSGIKKGYIKKIKNKTKIMAR